MGVRDQAVGLPELEGALIGEHDDADQERPGQPDPAEDFLLDGSAA